MTAGVTIEFDGLSKSFGAVQAVDDLTFHVEPGKVTGFLGPNGAGKTTTLRMLLGLVQPSSGTATFGGVPYAKLPVPAATVGAALEAASFVPGRTARNHLRVHASAARLPSDRVDAVLAQVGLLDVADRRVAGYSLGMRQRLGLATALLGDPGVLVLDEPINGLDPEGIKWIRGFLTALAAEGRTVLISSHLLSEVQQSVDEVVIIAKGRLAHVGTLASLDAADTLRVVVNSPEHERLAEALTAAGYTFDQARSGLVVHDVESIDIGRVALAAGIPLSALSRHRSGLEDSFLALVSGGEDHA
ncbi:ABC transporter ATP-binding protein [Plantibacter sp. LMC-P-059a]|jgi:ABC-2 type transport system ATP-binding protein|uniref:ABC transporter ATP-binding protein n=1 Tax=Plantibacter sp. LMC-P-059a TaxID=3040297 RepID=UPI00254D249D|nr:ABC transporter ATP-binding protein [Plantibacter sp. LMC-P-059a]